MAQLVMDALSHQAIRESGRERQIYGPAVPRAGEWAGVRLAGFRRLVEERGDQLVIEQPTRPALEGAAVLVVASRSQLLPFSTEALAAIAAFVEGGGGLLLMGNHRGMVLPQQQLAAAMRLPVAFINGSIGGDPAIESLPHALTDGVTQLVVRNACWLTAQGEAAAERFARFGPGHGFGYAMTHGKGRVVALGDSGFLASRDDAERDMFAAGSNARLFANILGWLGRDY